MSNVAFDFGQNWKEFSEHALTPERFQQARTHFDELMQGVEIDGKSFIDIGFGQGLALLCSMLSGARAFGLDINPKCREVFAFNRARFLQDEGKDARVAVGSILDRAVLHEVHGWAPGGFDIVHSWGVLHHTGAMWTAIENAASLVAPNGHLVLAIYNRHWSSRAWTLIKKTYVRAPGWIQALLNWLFVPVIYLAKLIATRRNPLRKERGMDFYYDVVDWIGGFPYEYASRDEIERIVTAHGFTLERFVPCNVPIGCNEFVFKRR
jgi:2-polyprenyl-6-hydroxyphenyl methylase/3-demethylubiquinone-9 3-methyltransferase